MAAPLPRVEIAATGRHLPDNIVTNDDLALRLDTSDEWIRTRTGIVTRRIADDETGAAAMGVEAARAALAEAGLDASDVDVLIVSTATPDRWLPSTACDIQELLGADGAFAFDLHAACSGFLYALTMAEGFLVAGHGDVALVVAAEKMTGIVDWEDRATCVLFGDGAGAAVVRRSEHPGRGIVASYHRSDGSMADLLCRPSGGVREPMSADVLVRRTHLVQMEGREVFKNAVRSMSEAAGRVLEIAEMGADDIDLMIPHQANVRIVEATARYAGIDMDRVYVNLDRYGNMSSATIPVALDEAREQGLVGPGSTVLTAAFGAGLTWGAMIWRF